MDQHMREDAAKPFQRASPLAYAACCYFALVLAAGFALWSLRVFWIARVIGEVGAVAVEVPIMLLAAWVASAWTMKRFSVGESVRVRLAVGVSAFALLQLAETALAYGLCRITPGDYWRSKLALAGALGLA